MSLLWVVLASGVFLGVAYRWYGGVLSRLLGLSETAATPAESMRDDVDYSPTEVKFLLGQHFSAIAAAGPIVGPILAGVWFGWGPALLWILIGSVFIGGVHDILTLTASVRHQAKSIAGVVREHMSGTSYLLFLVFIWIALVYIVVAFTDLVARSFVGAQVLENGVTVSGGGIATSSLLYLALPVAMGLLLRYTRLSLGWATVIFLPLVGVAIWVGQLIPLDLAALLNISESDAAKVWDVLLLGYCFVASMSPLWLLLQPRGHLGGYFLYAALLAGVVGIVLGGEPVRYPMFTGWVSPKGETLVPTLFITIACGACSGFHCLIASGTTSKQLRKETDAKAIGYGAMLLEAMVAVVSLCCVMIATREGVAGLGPNFIYAKGLGRFLEVVGVPTAFGVSFGLLAFTTFVYDTLDVCTRLGRYIVQELTGMHNAVGRWLGTGLSAVVPLLFVTRTATDVSGKPVPAWQTFWPIFGASNQLMAALALLGVTVWLWRTQRAWWIGLVAGLPTAFMYVVSSWALLGYVRTGFFDDGWGFTGLTSDPVPWVALVLVGLAGLVLVEAVRVFSGGPPRGEAQPVTAAAG